MVNKHKGGISDVNLSIAAAAFFWAWKFIPWKGRMNTSTPSPERKYRDRILFAAYELLKANGVEDVIVGDLEFLQKIDKIIKEINERK